MICVIVVTTACARREESVDLGRPFRGGAVGDEPRAVLLARDILAAGGSAADAAAALYFALAVTLPSRASLGGGGSCLVWDAKDKVEALDFLVRAPRAPGGERPAATPVNLRGLAAVQGKYGRLRWSQIVAPAENLARFGVPVSRALATDLAEWAQDIGADPAARAVFVGPTGATLAEGQMLVQRDLAGVLGELRGGIAELFHAGPVGARFVAAARAAGANLSVEDLREATPSWQPALMVRYDSNRVFVPPPPVLGGLTEGQIFAMLGSSRSVRRAGPEERPHLLAEATLRALADRQRWLGPDLGLRASPADIVAERQTDALMAGYRADRRVPPASLQPPPAAVEWVDPYATVFATVDATGQAVACAVTAHGPFGNGRMAPGTGIFLADLPDAGGATLQSLGPMIAIRGRNGPFVFAGAAAGGLPAAPVLAGVAARVLIDERPLEEASDAPRVFHQGAPDEVLAEPDPTALAALAARGYATRTVNALAIVNAIHCPDGVPAKPGTCRLRADRRGAGLSSLAE